MRWKACFGFSGSVRDKAGQGVMVQFCGQDRVQIDANGRVRLPPRLAAEFDHLGPGVTLYMLPEGALAVYPQAVWEELSQLESVTMQNALNDIRTRRRLRRLGAWAQPEKVSSQGRLTIPHQFREVIGLEPGTEVVVVGCGIGLELWAKERWDAEMGLVLDHERRRDEALMAADLSVPEGAGGVV